MLCLAHYVGLLCGANLIHDHELFSRQGRPVMWRFLLDRKLFILVGDELVLAVDFGKGLGGGGQRDLLNLSARRVSLLIVEHGLKIELLHVVPHVDYRLLCLSRQSHVRSHLQVQGPRSAGPRRATCDRTCASLPLEVSLFRENVQLRYQLRLLLV